MEECPGMGLSRCGVSVQVWEGLGVGEVSRYGSVWVMVEFPGMGLSRCWVSVQVWECLGDGGVSRYGIV